MVLMDPLIVRVAWEGLLLPFLWVQVFFKIHALKLTKQAFRRGQGLCVKEGSWTLFPEEEGAQSDLEGPVR